MNSPDPPNLVAQAVRAAKAAQTSWASQLARHRLRAIGKVANQLAEHHRELLELNPRPNAGHAEVTSSELIPLADACRFTSRIGRRVLAPVTRSFRHGAWWMGRIGVRVTREPWGTILILAPNNYPLFLPGVQIIQALAAGNAVVVKPAPGCEAVLHRFGKCLADAGIPAELVQWLDATVAAGQAAIAAGVDKVVLTGSAHTGRAVLSQLQESLVPATLELSGCDAVFVTEQADLKRVANCLAFALQLNGGATCIAPRRVFVTPKHDSDLCQLLVAQLKHLQTTAFHVPSEVVERIHSAVRQATSAGAEIVVGRIPELGATTMEPLVLRDVAADMPIAREDLFGPVMSLLPVRSMHDALAADRQCPYHLGAAVFGPTNHAEFWGSQINAGCIVINDLIAPTADPRVPFGGRDESGWGVTRGWEGLLEMTRPKVICTRYGRWLPHLDASNSDNPQLMSALLQIVHARSTWTKLTALQTAIRNLNLSRNRQQ